MVSIVIPSKNEPYLHNTIADLLSKATGKIEIIAVLDGYWEEAEKIIDDKRVLYIHFGASKGMRAAINAGVAISKGEYILKCDAHTLWDKGFDEALTRDCMNNWVVIPRRYALDPVKWEIEQRTDNKYPIDYMFLDEELHGREWRDKNRNALLELRKIDDLMSFQGSAWFMNKSYFEKLQLMDEDKFGTFYGEAQEIGLKVWMDNGFIKVNKKTWYAHWHKTKGRGYSLNNHEARKGERAVRELFELKKKYFTEIVKTFGKLPTWTK